MISVYPTLTYTIHPSMMTGVYPDRHHIINNETFVPEMEHAPWYRSCHHFDHDVVTVLEAAKREAEAIEARDLNAALDTLLFGMERRGTAQLTHEREVTAAHEAGHAILTAVLMPNSAIRKVSILPTGRGAAG